MKAKPSLWFDCDGVLLDWTRPFLQHAKHTVTYDELRDIDLSKLYENPDHFGFHMHSFHNSQEFWALPPIVDPALIRWLKEKTGCTINVITQIEDEQIPRLARICNLEDVFGVDTFDEVHFTVRGQCKLEYISNLIPHEQFIIIEDHPATLGRISERIKRDLIERGHTNVAAFGVMHPYNREAMLPINYIQQVRDTNVAVGIIREIIKHYG